MRLSDNRGFTLIEVIMASCILVIGVGIISSIIMGLISKNFQNQRQTQAVIIAQNKIEELIIAGYDSPDLTEGQYENDMNPINALGDSNGIFYQSWEIEDVKPIPKSKLITSTVKWQGTDEETKDVVLTAVCIDQSN